MDRTEISIDFFVMTMDKSIRFDIVRDYVISCGDSYIDKDAIRTILCIKEEKKDV